MANTLHTIFGNAKIDHEGYYRITSSKEGKVKKHGLEWVELCEVKIES